VCFVFVVSTLSSSLQDEIEAATISVLSLVQTFGLAPVQRASFSTVPSDPRFNAFVRRVRFLLCPSLFFFGLGVCWTNTMWFSSFRYQCRNRDQRPDHTLYNILHFLTASLLPDVGRHCNPPRRFVCLRYAHHQHILCYPKRVKLCILKPWDGLRHY